MGWYSSSEARRCSGPSPSSGSDGFPWDAVGSRRVALLGFWDGCLRASSKSPSRKVSNMARRVVVFSVVTGTVLDGFFPWRLLACVSYSFSSCRCIIPMHNDIRSSSYRITGYPSVVQSLTIAIQRIW